MKFPLLPSVVILFALVPSFAYASINLTINSGSLGVSARNYYNPLYIPSQQTNDPAGFGVNGLTRTATEGGASVSATYNWTNLGGIAVFESVVNSQTHNTGADESQCYQIFTFTLNEPAYFAIDGRISGTSTDASDEASVHAYLRSTVSGYNIGYEYDYSKSSSFDLHIDGVQQGNYFFSTQGLFDGLLSPGQYTFFGRTLFRDDSDHVSNMAASGFTRLTLTSVAAVAAPEPFSVIVWGCLIAAVAVLRPSCR